MITVGIDCIVELLCADRPKAHMVQMVLYREKIPYTPYKGKRRKVLKVNTFIMIAGMLWTNVNTGFFAVKRNEFQLFVGQDMLELVELFLCNITMPISESPWATRLLISSTVPSKCSTM